MNFLKSLRRDMKYKLNKRSNRRTGVTKSVDMIRGCTALLCIPLLVLCTINATGTGAVYADEGRALTPVPKPISLSLEGAYAAFDKSPGGALSAIEEKRDYGNYRAASQDYSRLIKAGGRDTYEADKLRLSRNYFHDMIERNKKMREISNRMRTFELYFTYKQTKKDITVAEKNLAIAEKRAQIEQLKYNAGLISRVDLLKTQTSLSSSKKQFESAKTNLDTMKRKFNIHMGFDPMQEVTLTTEITIQTLPSKKPSEIIAEAKNNGIVMSTAAYQFEQAKIAFSEVSAYPRDSAVYINAKNNMEIAKINMQNKPATIDADIQDKYNEMLRCYETIAEKEEALARTRDAFRIAQAAFRTGMNIKADVQEADLAVFIAESEIARAITEYNVAAVKYEMAGITNAEN